MANDLILSLPRVDAAITEVAARIIDLDGQLNAAKTQMERLTIFREIAIQFGSPVEGGAIATNAPVDASTEPKKLPKPGSKAALIGEGAITAIRTSGKKHIQTSDLLALIRALNVEIGGDNEVSYLASILSRDPRFVSERPHGWRLTEIIQGGEALLEMSAEDSASPTDD